MWKALAFFSVCNIKTLGLQTTSIWYHKLKKTKPPGAGVFK